MAWDAQGNLKGPQGDQGNAGPGVPSGGGTGQVLVKIGPNDYIADWEFLTKSYVGLGNVNDTSDANKPVSIATQAALDLKANDSGVAHNTGDENIDGEKTFLKSIRIATGTSSGRVSVSSIVGQISDFALESNGIARWVIRCQNDAELGGNTGSTFSLRSRDDSGSQLHTIFQVDRATGVLNFGQVAPTIGGNRIWHEGILPAGSGTYTPTCTGVSNVTSCSGFLCNWTRAGAGFVVSGAVQISPTASNTATTLDLSLPLVTAFVSGSDCSGPVTGKAAGVPSYEIGQISASAGTGNLRLNFYPATTYSYTLRFSIVVPIL